MPIEAAVPTNAITGRNIGWLVVVGRLRDSVTLDSARSGMDLVVRRLDRKFWNKEDRRVVVGPLTEHIVGGVRRPLVALFAAVSLLLLVGCTNIAGLLLTRSTERSREIAVRAALGASRSNLVRQILIEILPATIGGAAAGFVLSHWLVRFLVSGRGLELPPGVEVATDYVMLWRRSGPVVSDSRRLRTGSGRRSCRKRPPLARRTAARDAGRRRQPTRPHARSRSSSRS